MGSTITTPEFSTTSIQLYQNSAALQHQNSAAPSSIQQDQSRSSSWEDEMNWWQRLSLSLNAAEPEVSLASNAIYKVSLTSLAKDKLPLT